MRRTLEQRVLSHIWQPEWATLNHGGQRLEPFDTSWPTDIRIVMDVALYIYYCTPTQKCGATSKKKTFEIHYLIIKLFINIATICIKCCNVYENIQKMLKLLTSLL